MKNILIAILIAVISAAVLTPGLGYKPLWQDEIETAERARTILQSGWPKVIDAEGRLSVNTGGLELEDSDLHRYTPWVQFYVAAFGLSVFGSENPDKSVRLPFVVAHGLSNGVLYLGMTTLGLSSPIAALATIGLSVNSIRILHNSTARYHALLDLLMAIGLLLVALRLKHNSNWSLAGLFVVFLLLFHTQTFGGGVAAVCLCLLLILAEQARGKTWRELRLLIAFLLLAGLIATISNIALTRPYIPRGWGDLSKPRIRSMSHFIWLGFPFLWALGLGYFMQKKGSRRPYFIFLALEFLLLMVADMFSFSQTRYYLFLIFTNFLALLYFLNWREAGLNFRRLAFLLCLGIGLQEFVVAPLGGDRSYVPLVGIQTVFENEKNLASGNMTPLREAMLMLADAPTGAVLVDYVPQYVNWYTNKAVALIPDFKFKTELNEGQAAWGQIEKRPRYHLFYESYNGYWPCSGACSFKREALSGDQYELFLPESLGLHSIRMCLVKEWVTSKWDGAPFVSLEKSFNGRNDRLILAEDCKLR